MINQPIRHSEMVAVCHDRRTGTRAVIAIDDATCGPGLGGVRWAGYPSEQAAVSEAQRLAAGMTLKHASAGLPYGGAKSVIFETATDDRVEVMRAFGRFVARLGGAYIPGVDMGTKVEDLAVLRPTVDVSCDEEDPSPATAMGVYHAIRAATGAVFGSDLAGRRVAIQGVGHVGAALADLVARDGAEVIVADVDGERADRVARSVGGRVTAVEDILTCPSDVFAPCASARIIDEQNMAGLGARIVAGAANDTLSSRGCAKLLADRDVTYVPDFVANAGGVIHIHALRSGWDADRLSAELSAIGDRVTQILTAAGSRGVTPLEVAEQLASERVGHPVTLPD
ncbi:MAG TPA: Glu/Leu/Phe/Val dehydrogenase dimerization domain-containing protein [Acidimicrobiales bacterium]|nr:Glu/Leu/Phe/Val dehydrogenase dimerization domain-containing protein [Acidimicrobiales bacterium]